jgi:hypothetical protein
VCLKLFIGGHFFKRITMRKSCRDPLPSEEKQIIPFEKEGKGEAEVEEESLGIPQWKLFR